MANDYYSKNKCAVLLCGELQARGWTINGYKEDTSDCMTDYYNPASWHSYATKGEYIIAVDAYDSGKPITRSVQKEGPCSVCAGTGAMLRDGALLRRLIPGVGLSEPELEYRKGDSCQWCKGTGRRMEYHTETIGQHPVFPGPRKGMSLCLSRNGQMKQEFRFWRWESNDYGSRKGCNEIEARALADRIDSCTKDRPAPAADAPYEAAALTGAIIRRNAAKGGLEVAFPRKPDPETLSALKSQGFRWSSMAKVWWIKYNASAEAAARRILGIPAPQDGQEQPPAPAADESCWDDDPALLGATCTT